eukprot:1501302-Rhodomonas_salina.2
MWVLGIDFGVLLLQAPVPCLPQYPRNWRSDPGGVGYVVSYLGGINVVSGVVDVACVVLTERVKVIDDVDMLPEVLQLQAQQECTTAKQFIPDVFSCGCSRSAWQPEHIARWRAIGQHSLPYI